MLIVGTVYLDCGVVVVGGVDFESGELNFDAEGRGPETLPFEVEGLESGALIARIDGRASGT